MLKTDLAAMRQNYSQSELTESTVSADPFEQFAHWMNDAIAAGLKEPNAMTLATVSPAGIPSTRVVLLKGFDTEGFLFFTNYESRKGRDLEQNPNANLHFFWLELERQINIGGVAECIAAEGSDQYFSSRPFESRIGAWASHQSEQLDGRAELEARVAELSAKYADGNVPRPPYWGGYRVRPNRFEFWQGRESRLHDRICYEISDASWQISRLSP